MSRRDHIGVAHVRGARVDSVYRPTPEVLEVLLPTIEAHIEAAVPKGYRVLVAEVEERRIHYTSQIDTDVVLGSDDLWKSGSFFVFMEDDFIEKLRELSQPGTRYDRPDPV